MRYKYLTQDDIDDTIAGALIAREKEHFHYDLNRQNYEHILRRLEAENLPAEWPTHLLKFRNLRGEQLATALNGKDYRLAARLQFRDRIRLLLQTTLTEQATVEAVYGAMEELLPDDSRRLAAVQRVQMKQQARASLTLPEGFVRALQGYVGELVGSMQPALRNGLIESEAHRG